MSLGFDCSWVFLWWVLPSSWLIEGHSLHPVLYSVVQMWAGCFKLILLCVQGFEASLSLLFSCLFWVISPPFSCISRSVLDWVSVAPIPSFTFFRRYLLMVPLLVGFLFQQVYWYSQLPPWKFSGIAKWNLSYCLNFWNDPSLGLTLVFSQLQFYCLTVWFFNVLYNICPPIFIYAGIPLAVHSVPQKIS